MEQYTVWLPFGGVWEEMLSSDDKQFGGSGILNGALKAEKKPSHGHGFSITFRLPPLSVQIFKGGKPPKARGAEKSSSKKGGSSRKAGAGGKEVKMK